MTIKDTGWQGRRIAALETALEHAERALEEIGEVIGWDAKEKTLLQAVKDEWHDFMMVCNHCSTIYDAASGGMISKPQTLPIEVISRMEDITNELVDERVKEETEEWRTRLAEAEQERDALAAECKHLRKYEERG